MKVKLLSRARLLATPGSSIHGIFQARVLEWGAKSKSYIYYNLWLNTKEGSHVAKPLEFCLNYILTMSHLGWVGVVSREVFQSFCFYELCCSDHSAAVSEGEFLRINS